MIENKWIWIVGAAVVILFIFAMAALSNRFSLNGIKMRTVGDGQHGTARWATQQAPPACASRTLVCLCQWHSLISSRPLLPRKAILNHRSILFHRLQSSHLSVAHKGAQLS